MRFDRLDPAPFSIDIGTSEKLVHNANGGNDSFSATGNLAALIQITADGGAGADAILGGDGIDLLLGGDGDDFIDGQQGNDNANDHAVTGSFNPEGVAALSAFNGLDASGEWRLTVDDTLGGFIGTLFSWSLDFDF